MTCTHCSTSLDATTAFTRVQGWEKRANASTSRKGGSDITLRERLDEHACHRCVDRLKSGLSVEQESLL